MNSFPSIAGTITAVHSLAGEGGAQSLCSFLLELQTSQGAASLVLTPNTYVHENESLKSGDRITAFYDPNAPVPLIYPPRYTALVIAETEKGSQAVLDVFDHTLTSSDGTLRLTPDSDTDILTPNGQKIRHIPGGNLLLVIFSATTRSIPALTVPEDIVVFCREA